jgi:hypothetical protein
MRDGPDYKIETKKAIRYDKIQFDIDLIQYDMKMTILRKILFKFQFQEHFYVKIANVKRHNLILWFYDNFM